MRSTFMSIYLCESKLHSCHIWLLVHSNACCHKILVLWWVQARVKWTTLDPCSGLCESDPKLYTNFECYEIEIHKHLKNIWIYKAKQFMFTKKQLQTMYIYSRRRCKWWTSGWHIEKIIVKNLFKIYLHYMNSMNLQTRITMTSSL